MSQEYRVANSNINERELAALYQLIHSEGYSVLERLMENQLDDLTDEAVSEEATQEEWTMCKGGIKTIRFILDMSESVVSEFEKMKKDQEN